MCSIDSKMNVIGMINTLNVDSKVGRVVIELSDNHEWNSEILALITNRYTNVYYIVINDWNSSVND